MNNQISKQKVVNILKLFASISSIYLVWVLFLCELGYILNKSLDAWTLGIVITLMQLGAVSLLKEINKIIKDKEIPYRIGDKIRH